MSRRLYDILDDMGKPRDTRTGQEIADDVIRRLGLKRKEESNYGD